MNSSIAIADAITQRKSPFLNRPTIEIDLVGDAVAYAHIEADAEDTNLDEAYVIDITNKHGFSIVDRPFWASLMDADSFHEYAVKKLKEEGQAALETASGF